MKERSEESCVVEILRIIPMVEDKYKTKLEFLGFDGEWKGSKDAKAVFKCLTHDCIFTTNYYHFTKKLQISCKDCIKTQSSLALRKWSMDEAIELINNKLTDLLLDFGLDLEFLGFFDSPMFGRVRKSDRIIVRCRKHNRVGHPSIERFIRSGFYCKDCVREKNSKEFQLTDEDIFNRLTKLHPDYKFFDIVRVNNDTGVSLVSAECPNSHEPFQRTIQSFFKNEIHCPTCEAIKMKYKFENRVNNAIKERQKFGLDLRFDGFVDNNFIGQRTKLLLHCNRCNVSWNTTDYSSFVWGGTVCGCPVCSGTNKISFPEDQCNVILRNILGSDIIIHRQYKIDLDKYPNRTYKSNIFVDFYIPSFNLIIEYNGEQHYEYNGFFHKTVKDFEAQVERDKCLQDYCTTFSVDLLVIPYVDLRRINDILEKYLITKIDTTTKLIPKLI